MKKVLGFRRNKRGQKRKKNHDEGSLAGRVAVGEDRLASYVEKSSGNWISSGAIAERLAIALPAILSMLLLRWVLQYSL